LLSTYTGVLVFAFGVDHLDIFEADSPGLYQQSVFKLTAPTTTNSMVLCCSYPYSHIKR